MLTLGIQAEHQHIERVSDSNQRKFNQLEVQHTALENHMKDLHAALKGVMGKTKTIAHTTGELQHDFGLQRNDVEQNITHVSEEWALEGYEYACECVMECECALSS